ncbi:MAG: GatB/YqeY domain-containing protein [Tidjanibacter sp.]|nr:GatB/YqeY domain-containing protein [Tidjanibacter sp.]
MALEQQIQNDIAAAMKARNQVKLDALRAVKSAILIAKTAGAGIELTDADIVKIMQKQVKQRRESAEMYTSAGRPELAEAELAQAAAIEEYLPKQFTPEELEANLRALMAELGVDSPQQMGKVMGVATKKFAGLADGRAISEMVKKILA